MHLTKYIALHTSYSRRKAEELIKQKRIKIYNEIAQLGEVIKGGDKIYLDNKLVQAQTEDLIVLMLNKPINFTCTKKCFKNENNVYQLLPKKYQHLKIIGRLDKYSQGLLLLTNNGSLINQLSHPRFKHQKKYQVKTSRELSSQELDKMKKGIKDQGEKLKLKEIVKEKNTYIISLTEGRNRQIRRMFNFFNIEVISLKRISVNRLEIKDLKIKEFRLLNDQDLKDLYFSEKWLK